jgi:hypothetical protein
MNLSHLKIAGIIITLDLNEKPKTLSGQGISDNLAPVLVTYMVTLYSKPK